MKEEPKVPKSIKITTTDGKGIPMTVGLTYYLEKSDPKIRGEVFKKLLIFSSEQMKDKNILRIEGPGIAPPESNLKKLLWIPVAVAVGWFLKGLKN